MRVAGFDAAEKLARYAGPAADFVLGEAGLESGVSELRPDLGELFVHVKSHDGMVP